MTKTNLILKLSTEEEKYRRLTESIARNLQRAESLKCRAESLNRDMEKFVNSLERLVKKIRGKTSRPTQPL